jgi:hypothetical protein
VDCKFARNKKKVVCRRTLFVTTERGGGGNYTEKIYAPHHIAFLESYAFQVFRASYSFFTALSSLYVSIFEQRELDSCRVGMLENKSSQSFLPNSQFASHLVLKGIISGAVGTVCLGLCFKELFPSGDFTRSFFTISTKLSLFT